MSVDERSQAEPMMDSLENEETSASAEKSWPLVSRRIADARAAAGLSDTEVAHGVGITIQAYGDLEGYDDEAYTVLWLSRLRTLCHVLNVTPKYLLIGSDTTSPASITFDDIADRLSQRIASDGTNADAFGKSIGWDVASILDNPQSLSGWTVEGLYNVAKAVGLDWVAALPE